MDVRSILITGVHTGLGRALARRFHEDGAEVCALSRSEPRAMAGRERWSFESVDLRHEDAIQPALVRAMGDRRQLDLVVLNAGVLGPIRDLAETSSQELRAVMDLNVWANKNLLDALQRIGVTPRLVIGISSGAAVNGSGGWGAYSISKAALNLLMSVMADERPDTHFIALAPGIVDTPMTRELYALPDHPRHPATRRVKAAFDENRVWTPEAAATNIRDHLDDCLAARSGSFLDVRNL